MKEALILIDIQNIYFAEGDYKLHEPEKAVEKAAQILSKFRSENGPIIHVRHMFNVAQNDKGDYLLDFNEAVKPKGGEIIVSKNYPNAFLKTNLYEEIKNVNEDSLVIIGMMSHMCIDTTVREAQNYDYKVTVIHDTCTTKDLEWNGEKIKASTVHKSIMASLNGMFAEVLSAEEYLKL